MALDPKVGLRQYFESNGMNVNYVPTSKNINVLNPKTNQYKTFAPGSYDNTNGTAQIGLSQAQGLFAQPKPQFDYQNAFKNYKDASQFNDFSNAWNQAQKQADYQANQQRSGYQNQLNLLSANHDSSLKGVDTGLTNAKQDLQDNSFQKYLASRQSLANSGVSGTGLANDANTRLELANNRSLAQLENNANQQRYSIDNAFNTQSQGIAQQMNSIDPATIAQGLYNQYRAQALQEQQAKANALWNVYQAQAQQDQRTQDNQYRDNQADYQHYTDARDFQNNNDWKQKTFDNSNDQWNKQFDFNKENTDWTHNFQDKQFNANEAFKQQQLALAQQRAASGGGRSSGGRSSSSGSSTPGDWKQYFAQQLANGVTSSQILDYLDQNSENLQSNGEDPQKMKDAVVELTSNGRFKTQKSLNDWVKQNWTKQNDKAMADGEIDSPMYGPPNLARW